MLLIEPVTNVRLVRCGGQETCARTPKRACGTTTSALTRGSSRMIGSPARLVDFCRHRGILIARTSAAAGLSLTLAAAVAPGVTGPSAANAGARTGGSLRSLLNPSGAETHADPAEEMSAQQSFAAKHFGSAGLASPFAT